MILPSDRTVEKAVRVFWVIWLFWAGLVGAGAATAIYVAVHFLRKVW